MTPYRDRLVAGEYEVDVSKDIPPAPKKTAAKNGRRKKTTAANTPKK